MKRPKRGTAGKMGSNLSGFDESPDQKIDRKSFIKKLAVKKEIDGLKSAYVSALNSSRILTLGTGRPCSASIPNQKKSYPSSSALSLGPLPTSVSKRTWATKRCMTQLVS